MSYDPCLPDRRYLEIEPDLFQNDAGSIRALSCYLCKQTFDTCSLNEKPNSSCCVFCYELFLRKNIAIVYEKRDNR